MIRPAKRQTEAERTNFRASFRRIESPFRREWGQASYRLLLQCFSNRKRRAKQPPLPNECIKKDVCCQRAFREHSPSNSQSPGGVSTKSRAGMGGPSGLGKNGKRIWSDTYCCTSSRMASVTSRSMYCPSGILLFSSTLFRPPSTR